MGSRSRRLRGRVREVVVSSKNKGRLVGGLLVCWVRACLLEELGAVGAALGVVADLGVLVGAEAAVAGVAYGVGDGVDLVAVVHVDVVDRGLVAAGDGEGVTGFGAAGEIVGDELRGLCRGWRGADFAAEGGEGAGEAVLRVGGGVLTFHLVEHAQGGDGGGLVAAADDGLHGRDGEGHEDENDRHDDEKFDEREAGFCARAGAILEQFHAYLGEREVCSDFQFQSIDVWAVEWRAKAC
jgi:hypothetical protein